MIKIEPFFILDQFRFCMLCSVVLLDLLCNYTAFSFFQVVLVVLVFQDEKIVLVVLCRSNCFGFLFFAS